MADKIKSIYTTVISSMLPGISGLIGKENFAGVVTDLFTYIFKPIIDNGDKIKDVLSSAGELLGSIFGITGSFVDKLKGSSKSYEDSAIHKFFVKATEERTKKIGETLDKIKKALETLKKVIEGDIELPPVLEKVFNLLTKPTPQNIISFLFKGQTDKTLTQSKDTYDSIKSGSATKKVLGSVSSFFSNTLIPKWKTIKNESATKKVFGSMSDFFKNTLTSKWNAVKTEDATKKVKGSMSDFFKNDLTKKWNAVKTESATKKVFGSVSDFFKNTLTKKWNAVKSENATKTIKGSTADSFTNVQKKFTGLGSNIATKTIDGKVKSAFTAAKNEWAGVTDKTVTVTYNAVNTGNGIHQQQVPAFASGGYVRANTPTLAVIGDNHRYDEYVMPENKLLGIAQLAASLAGSGGGRDGEIVSLLTQLLKAIQGLNLSATVDVVALKKLIVRLINEHTQSTGVCEIYV